MLTGDLESGGSSTEQRCRQPNGGFEYSADDLDPGDAAQHYRGTSAAAGAAAEGPVLMPVSTHASIRERSPTRHSSSGSRTPQRRQQQQQQWQQSDGWLEEEDLGLVSLSNADGDYNDGMLGQQQQLQQHQQQRRLSIEMSSLPSSTPNSSRSSGTPPSQQQHQQEADAAAAGSSSSPTAAGEANQQGSSGGASDSDWEAGGASPGRLQKPRKASRLHKASR